MSVAPFANVCTTRKFYVWILHMSYYPVVVSDLKSYYISIENEAIEFSRKSRFSLFAKGDFVRSTFCKCLRASKILCMDSSHIVLYCGRLRSRLYYISIENEAIEFSRKSRFSLFAKGDVVRSTFCKCLCDSKKF